jgi:hypothetical protein
MADVDVIGSLRSQSIGIRFSYAEESVRNVTAIVSITTDDPVSPIFTFTVGAQLVISALPRISVIDASGVATPDLIASDPFYDVFGEVLFTNSVGVRHTYVLKNLPGASEALQFIPPTGSANIEIEADEGEVSAFSLSTILSSAIPAGENSTFDIIFKPTQYGSVGARLKNHLNDRFQTSTFAGNPFVVELAGIGIDPNPQPKLVIQSDDESRNLTNGQTATSFADRTFMGVLSAGDTSTLLPATYIVVSNLGSGDLNWTVEMTGDTAHFSLENQGELWLMPAPAANSLVISFPTNTTALSAGIYAVTFTIRSNDPINPVFTFRISADIVNGPVATMALLDSNGEAGAAFTALEEQTTSFGEVTLASSVSRTWISNSANATAALKFADTPPRALSANSGFTIDTDINVAELAPGESTEISVTFSPQAESSVQDVLLIATNDPYETASGKQRALFYITLEGTGTCA